MRVPLLRDRERRSRLNCVGTSVKRVPGTLRRVDAPCGDERNPVGIQAGIVQGLADLWNRARESEAVIQDETPMSSPSFAHTTNTSAMGELEIHILVPARR